MSRYASSIGDTFVLQLLSDIRGADPAGETFVIASHVTDNPLEVIRAVAQAGVGARIDPRDLVVRVLLNGESVVGDTVAVQGGEPVIGGAQILEAPHAGAWKVSAGSRLDVEVEVGPGPRPKARFQGAGLLLHCMRT